MATSSYPPMHSPIRLPMHCSHVHPYQFTTLQSHPCSHAQSPHTWQLHQAVHTLQHSQPHEIRIQPSTVASNDLILQPHPATSNHPPQLCTGTSSHPHNAALHINTRSPIYCIHAQPHQVTHTLQPCVDTNPPIQCSRAQRHQVTHILSHAQPHQITPYSTDTCGHIKSVTHCIHVQPHQVYIDSIPAQPQQITHTLQPCTATSSHPYSIHAKPHQVTAHCSHAQPHQANHTLHQCTTTSSHHTL